MPATCFFTREPNNDDLNNEIVYGDTQYINEDGSSEIVSRPDLLSKEFFIGNTINHQSAFYPAQPFCTVRQL